MRFVKRFNAAVPWYLRAVMVVLGGLLMLKAGLVLLTYVPGVYFKLRWKGECPWPQALGLYADSMDVSSHLEREREVRSVAETDPAWRIARVISTRKGSRPFWMSVEPSGVAGEMENLAYLVADHDWLAGRYPAETVHPGDVVIDVGAHVGVFVDRALRLGAAKVIAVEPNPTMQECLRRNFPEEIREGRVIPVPKAAWRQRGTLQLWLGGENSGMSSVVQKREKAVEVEAITIDELVADLGLHSVDFIKMDIEGAERDALAGAARTLAKFGPRMMLDAYHRPDDMQVLPAVVRAARPYRITCGPCQTSAGRLVPHVIFLAPAP